MHVRTPAAIAHTALAALTVGASAGPVTVHNNFALYDIAVASQHDHFIDFETDKLGNAIALIEDADSNGQFDAAGDAFSDDITYSSPDFPSGSVNLGYNGVDIKHQIGPMGTWDGTLRIEFAGPMSATGFTGVLLEHTATIKFFKGVNLVDSMVAGGSGKVFQFFGFTSTSPFDRVEITGMDFAIDAHYGTGYSSVVPLPRAAASAGVGLVALALRRRRPRM